LKTRERIIVHTINLFNGQGFANVTLQNIADSLKISLGNLTYHFPKKDDLINAIYHQLVEELGQLFNPYWKEPNFLNINNQLKDFYQFQQKYKFFYLDTLEIERAYPKIAAEHYKHIQLQINQTHQLLIYNIEQGNLNQKYDTNHYLTVAHKIWMSVALWSTQCTIRGIVDDTEKDMVDFVWQLIIPYFTKKGWDEYHQLNSK